MDLSPVLGRQPALGPYPKPGLPCPSRVRPTAASGNSLVCAGLVCLAPWVLLQAALGPGQEPGQERSMCTASGGARPAWTGRLGICRHHNLSTETGGCLDGGGPRPGERAGRGYPARGGVGEDTPVPTDCLTLDPSVYFVKPQVPHH